MKNYRRNLKVGATYFLTMCQYNRQSSLLIDEIDVLRRAYALTQQKKPFTVDAMVLLPDHIHALWTMPSDDADYSNRVRLFKGYFTKQLTTEQKATNNKSRLKKGEAAIWQRRYWGHTIKNEQDYINHMHYIHYNPVKHEYMDNVIDWQYSTFHREVGRGRYPADWGSDGRVPYANGEFGNKES